MKPPIEYRPKAAPKKAALAVTKDQAKYLGRILDAKIDPETMVGGPGNAPPLSPGGRWVWVRDDQICALRPRQAVRNRMREYMRKRRKKADG